MQPYSGIFRTFLISPLLSEVTFGDDTDDSNDEVLFVDDYAEF